MHSIETSLDHKLSANQGGFVMSRPNLQGPFVASLERFQFCAALLKFRRNTVAPMMFCRWFAQ